MTPATTAAAKEQGTAQQQQTAAAKLLLLDGRMEAAPPGGYFCAPRQFSCVETTQQLHSRETRQGRLQQKIDWQVENKDDEQRLQRERELKHEQKSAFTQQKKSETEDEQQENAQYRGKAAATPQVASRLSEFYLPSAFVPSAAQDTLPRVTWSHLSFLHAADAVTKVSSVSAAVVAVLRVAAMSPAALGSAAAAAPSRGSGAAVLAALSAHACVSPPSATVCKAPLPPAVATPAAATVAAAPAADAAAARRVRVPTRPETDFDKAALRVPCATAFVSTSACSIASCCMRFDSLLQVRLLVLLLLLMCDLLLLHPPMRAKSLSLGAFEKRPLQTLLGRPHAEAATSSRPELLFRCRNLTLPPESSTSSFSAEDLTEGTAQCSAGPAATISATAADRARDPGESSIHSIMQLHRTPTGATATRDAAASCSHADSPWHVAAAKKSPAAAAYGSPSVARRPDVPRTITAAAAPSLAAPVLITETAARRRLKAPSATFLGSPSAAAGSAALVQQHGLKRWRLQQQMVGEATPTLLSHGASHRQASTVATSATPPRRPLTAGDHSIAAVAGPPPATLFFGAANSAFRRATPAAVALSATASPVLILQKVFCLAFDCPLRAAAWSSDAAFSQRRSDGARTVSAVPAAAPPPTATAAGRSSARPTKTTAAGSIRAAEYVGAATGGRPRHMEGSLNRVSLIGRLGAEPEIRQMSNGEKYAWFSMATSSHWVDKATGDLQARTEWHRVVVYDDSLVDLVDKYLQLLIFDMLLPAGASALKHMTKLSTGRRVFVEGKLQTRRWTGSDGAERYTTSVVVSRYQGDLILLDHSTSATASSLTAGAGSPPPRGDGTELPTG